MSPNEVKKSSGLLEQFDEEKLCRSLIFAGASKEQAKRIVNQVSKKISEDASTRKIFSHAFKLLKKESKILASQYSLTKSIHELGPDGFLFEKYICALFSAMGFNASTNHYLDGKCVKHEVDVIAVKSGQKIFCECKFHNHPSYKNDLKTALYVQARHLDLKSNKSNQLSEFWLISNTKFSTDAIEYSRCSGLKLIGPNYPHKSALGDLARKYHVHPITCLTTLKKMDSKKLLKKHIILANELIKNPLILDEFNIHGDYKNRILKEAHNLMRVK